MQILPAIDLIGGKCVRLTEGDYSTQKTYNENPVEVAQDFEARGITRLHLVDLDGAKAGKIINHHVLREIAQKTRLQIDFGGGVKSDEDLALAFECGAKQVTLGSIAVQQPDKCMAWLEQYGAEKLILGADVKDEQIRISGWAENSQINLFDFLEKYEKCGIKYVICTDIAKDGKQEGTSIALYQKIRNRFPYLHLIASGGVTYKADLEALQAMGAYGAIVGKALYEGSLSWETLLAFNI
jgi:phosphoribosylformimino-5-aminoimidazole carboxamide ribotide isomerase